MLTQHSGWFDLGLHQNTTCPLSLRRYDLLSINNHVSIAHSYYVWVTTAVPVNIQRPLFMMQSVGWGLYSPVVSHVMFNSDSKKVGTLCKTLIKQNNDNLFLFYLNFIHWSAFSLKPATQCWKFQNAPKTPVWNILQENRFIGNGGFMIGYESSVLEKLSCSQARVGRGSPSWNTWLYKGYLQVCKWLHYVFAFYMASQLQSRL